MRRYRTEIKYVIIAAVLVGAMVGLARQDALAGLNSFFDTLMDTVTRLDFVGVLGVAIVGNFSPMIQVPYNTPVLSIALDGATLQHLLWLGLWAGVVAGLGEISAYYIADRLLAHNPDLEKSKLYGWIKRNVDQHPRKIALMIFIWGATILPDDMVLIPLAVVGYGIRRVWLPLFISKVAHNLMVSAVFYQFSDWASRYVSTELKANMALVILILFVLVILYQVEKTKVLSRQGHTPKTGRYEAPEPLAG